MSKARVGRTAVFIDGANLYATIKSLEFEMDYKLLTEWLDTEFDFVIRKYYFTAVDEQSEFVSIKPLIDFLDYNGYNVVTKALKEFQDADGRRKVKGNMDIELVVTMLEMAHHVENIVLFSGDGDFRAAIEAVKRQGCYTTVISTIKTNPKMVSDDLRRAADEFIDLSSIIQEVTRKDVSARVASR